MKYANIYRLWLGQLISVLLVLPPPLVSEQKKSEGKESMFKKKKKKKEGKISVLPLLIPCFYNPDKVLEYPVNQQKKASAIGN